MKAKSVKNNYSLLVILNAIFLIFFLDSCSKADNVDITENSDTSNESQVYEPSSNIEISPINLNDKLESIKLNKRIIKIKDNKKMKLVTIKTSVGNIHLELDGEKAPITVKNFVAIAKSGYYDGTIFHRVINGFMVQGGGLNADMSNKSSGTASIQNEANNGLTNDRGTVAMARTMEPHSATGQFFVNHKDNGFLNHTGENSQGWGYAVFGKVTEGMDVVDAIADVETGSTGGHQDVPVEVITIESVTVAE